MLLDMRLVFNVVNVLLNTFLSNSWFLPLSSWCSDFVVNLCQVPKGHVWLQGDNAYNSTDSRHYGPIPYALIQGKVFYRIWPPEGWGPVQNQQP
jgi:signal peptidase I